MGTDILADLGKWIAAAAILAIITGSAYAECAGVGPPLRPQSHNGPVSNFLGGLGNFFAGAAISPEAYEQQQRQQAARATYEALLAARAPEPLACAAALNPQVHQAIAGTYFDRPPC